MGYREYHPGGFPQNGSATDRGSGGNGERNYYVGDNWYFQFKNISPLYGYGSTLNVVEKSHLEAVFSIMKTQPQDFDKLVDMLVRRSLKINFKIDPTISYDALYDGETCSILFRHSDAINWENFREELVHAVQHLCYYGDNMNKKYKNFEFEAKVFIDLSYGIAVYYDNLFYLFNYIPPMTDLRPEFSDAYEGWIMNIFKKGWIPGSEYVGFNSLCEMWQGYAGIYLPTFDPKLIKASFGRVRPPLKPEN